VEFAPEEAKGDKPDGDGDPGPDPVQVRPEAPVAPASDISELRDEIDGLRRALYEAVEQLSSDMERAERLAADRARKEARKQGRKSERAARRAVQAAMDTPDDPT
jgi:hypothetical protein